MAGRESAATELLPARMLNEFAYCPRLMYLEWAEGQFAESADTVNGQFAHRRVDEATGNLPPATEVHADRVDTIHARSITLSDDEHGLIARMDLVEAVNGEVSPVDYKRGRAPDNPERCWEPERVQLCVQALILRSHGYACREGVLFYVESQERVRVPITDGLVERTLQLAADARLAADEPLPPPPLIDSPKCPRCSLAGICLPDETNLVLESTDQAVPRLRHDKIRPLYASRPDALPFYVTEPGAHVGKSGERLTVRADGKTLAEARLIDISNVGLFGGVQISTQAMQELVQREIPVTFYSHGGYFYGMMSGLPKRTVQGRIRQFAIAADDAQSLAIARLIVRGKILNQRTLLRRNADDLPPSVVPQLKALANHALRARGAETLLGIEGTAASLYYEHFPRMLSATTGQFEFTERNRRPPRDPVNALLSLCYSLLAKDLTVTLLAVGLDPYVGVYHRPGRGKPALALDLMEEFRPLVADSVVINAVNRGIVGPGEFVCRAGAVAMTTTGRRRLIEAYEQRMNDTITHPLFGYKVSYRRALEVQARLFMRAIQGELPHYVAFLTR